MTERSTTERAPLQLSITPLGASATQYYPSSDGQDRLGSTGLWSHVRAMGWSDEAGTLTLQGSDDRVTWSTIGSALTFTADVINVFEWTELTYRYWRWKFVNDATAQTLFRLYEDKTSDSAGTQLEAKDFTFQSASGADGDGTVGVLNGKFGTLNVQVVGSAWTGTINFEASQDGTNYGTIQGVHRQDGSQHLTATASGTFTFNVLGYKKFKCRQSGFAAGTVTVTGTAVTMSTGNPMDNQLIASSAIIGTVGIDQTTPGTTNAVAVTGSNVAHDAVDSGNPVKVGFKAESTTPAAVADGDRSNLGGTLYGAAFVNPVTSLGEQVTGATAAAVPAGAALMGGSASGTLQAIGLVNTDTQKTAIYGTNGGGVYGISSVDAVNGNLLGSAAFKGLIVNALPKLYNGTDHEPEHNNTKGTLLASAARTAAAWSAIQTNHNAGGVQVTLNVTAASGTGGLQVTIKAIDPVTGSVETRLAQLPTAITATGSYIYELGPGASTAGTAGSGNVNQRTDGQLPRDWILQVVHGDASSYTYSAGYALIV